MQKLAKRLLPIVPHITALVAQGKEELEMTFEGQLHAWIYFHLQEDSLGRRLLEEPKDNEFARSFMAPEKGTEKSGFFEGISTRGLTQLKKGFEALQSESYKDLPEEHRDVGGPTATDGSLIDVTFPINWPDYRNGAKEAKVQLGFDINHGIPPGKVFLTDGKEGERPFLGQILLPGQTAIMDCCYQCHNKYFDQWQQEGEHFVCRIKAKTTKTLNNSYDINSDSTMFYDALVLLGALEVNQTKKPVRVVSYKVNKVNYWIGTDRFDFTAEQIGMAYKLRWGIESFFAGWKRHFRVYQLIARGPYGLVVQILSGLVTCFLLAIYCHGDHGQKVSIKRMRHLRIQILSGARAKDRMNRQPIH